MIVSKRFLILLISRSILFVDTLALKGYFRPFVSRLASSRLEGGEKLNIGDTNPLVNDYGINAVEIFEVFASIICIQT